MSNSNEILKKCCKSEIIQVIEKLKEGKNRRDGVCPQGIHCRKDFYLKSLDKI